jgi:hypothetical protein
VFYGLPVTERSQLQEWPSKPFSILSKVSTTQRKPLLTLDKGRTRQLPLPDDAPGIAASRNHARRLPGPKALKSQLSELDG